MTEDGDRTVQYHFRIMGLTVEGIEELRSLAVGLPVRQGKHYRDERVSVVTIPIEEDADYSWLASFLSRHGIGQDLYGVYISLTTSRDEDGVGLPSHVLALSRSVGGTVDFSFCSIPDEA